MNKKLKYYLLLTGVASLICSLTGCNNNDPIPSEEEYEYTKESYDFQTIYRNSGVLYFDVYKPNQQDLCKKITYQINKYIGSFNYLKLEFSTDTDAVGWINYQNRDNAEINNVEKFYIKAGETKFTTFLDAYRDNCLGNFEDKVITSISFQGVDETKQGEFEFKSLSIGNKKYYKDRMYIDDGTIKIGTSTKFGGSIEWLERIDINVVEYLDNGFNVRIDKDIDPNSIESTMLISDSVNMVNIYDYGREIQPSYYLTVTTEENGYSPKTATNYESLSGDSNKKYNPIQCGGVGEPKNGVLSGAQIVDYEWTKDHIYIKTKAQDWLRINDQAMGYIEVNYHFDETQDGLLIVDNSYIDFYQFSNLDPELNAMTGQECPATYFSYPLNYLYMETKSSTVFDPYLGEQGREITTIIETPSTPRTSAGHYYYAMKDSYMKNACDWMAFVNDQKFGAGIFMPNADRYIASRGSVSCNYVDEPRNKAYMKSMFDFGDGYTPSYASSNYNYMNPQLRRRMVEFVPLEYQYALYIGDTNEMGEVFANAKANGLTNNNLTELTGTWPKK